LLKKENNVRKEKFQGLLNMHNTDNEEYIRLLAANQDLKARLDSIENKLDQFMDQVEFIYKNRANLPGHNSADDDSTYDEEVENLDKVEAEQLTSEQIETEDTLITGPSANLGKGEVRFIQSLLEK
jgi:seryl-tRNA synthetase